MLYYDFQDYAGFKERFGIIRHDNGQKSRRNKILLAFIKQPQLLRDAVATGDCTLINIPDMATLKKHVWDSLIVSGMCDDDLPYKVEVLDRTLYSAKYETDHMQGVCEDGDFRAIRYINHALSGRVYKKKAGRLLMELILETKYGQSLPEAVRLWFCEEFCQDWETFTRGKAPQETVLHVNKEFYRIYSSEELDNCNPDSVEVSEVPNTLRSSILEGLASNEALNSVPREENSSCVNPTTNKNYTYKELSKIYKDANGSEELNAASQLIKSCSALRVIPDALPAYKNEEALLASLNKLFNISNWEPESISPSGNTVEEELPAGLNGISVNVSVEANSGTTMSVLNNIERSIREFNIKTATIEWSGSDNLLLQAQANAYYMDKSIITETKKTIREDS